VALVLLLVALAAVSLRILDWQRRPRTTASVAGNQSDA